MNVLSLFDGMSCGMIAFTLLNMPVNNYVAYEIDEYAVKTAKYNFPNIQEKGNVFDADFTAYKGYDWLIGGSPCTYWSIAQSTDKRETTASGMDKSMAKDIRESISKTFGFEPILINSALVSAQNRNRLYWVGIRNFDGSYTKANIKLPKDKKIMLEDILDNGTTWQDKSYCLCANYHPSFNQSLTKHLNSMVAIPIDAINGKSHTLSASYYKMGSSPFSGYGNEKNRQRVAVPIKVGEIGNGGQGQRVYSVKGKSVTLSANGGGGGAKTGLYKIDLPDGEYIIRKLTIEECKKLQTVPKWYKFKVSKTQAYKMLGNGWTIEVIKHLIKNAMKGNSPQLG